MKLTGEFEMRDILGTRQGHDQDLRQAGRNQRGRDRVVRVARTRHRMVYN